MLIATCVREKKTDAYVFYYISDIFSACPVEKAQGKNRSEKEKTLKVSMNCGREKKNSFKAYQTIHKFSYQQETKLDLSLCFREIKPPEVKEVAKWVGE